MPVLVEAGLFWLLVITAFALLYRKFTRSKAVSRVAHDLVELPADTDAEVIEAYDEAASAAETRVTEAELDAKRRLATAEHLRKRIRR